MSRPRFRPFDDKAELERELMDADYRFLEGQEVGRLEPQDDGDDHVRHGPGLTPVQALAPATA